MPTYWLSFAPVSGPARVILLDATCFERAHLLAHQLGFYRNGDQVWGCEVPETEAEYQLPRGRQLTQEELDGVNAAKLGDVNPDVS